MLSERPKLDRDEPTLSPALVRRRDHMLGPDSARRHEPQSAVVHTAEDSEPDPDIPPLPAGARAAAVSDEADEMAPRSRIVPAAIAAGTLLALGAVVWVVYDRMADEPAGGDVPYVTAEAGPEKVRPDSEGGLDVPNQDIGIYNELSGTPAPAQPEVLLPPPEAPLAPPAPATVETPPDVAATDVPMVRAPELTMEPEGGGEAPAAEVTAATEPAAEPAAEAVETASLGAFRIQLAAVKDSAAAKAAWTKLAKKHPEVLGDLELKLVKVERSGSTLYRLQAGMFASRAAAEKACGKLKQKNQDCLVVAP